MDVSEIEKKSRSECCVERVERWPQILCTIDYMIRALGGFGCSEGVLTIESVVVSESRCLWQAAASALLSTTDLPKRFPTEFQAIPAPQDGLDGMLLSESDFLNRWKQLQTGLQSLNSHQLHSEESVSTACEAVIGTVSLLCQYQPPALIEASVVYHSSPSAARRASRFALPILQGCSSLEVNSHSSYSPSRRSSINTSNLAWHAPTASEAAVTNSSASIAATETARNHAEVAQGRLGLAFAGQNNSDPSVSTSTGGDAATPRGWFDGLFGAFSVGTSTKLSPSVEAAHSSVDAARRESWTVGKHSASDGRVWTRDGGPGFPLMIFSPTDQKSSPALTHVANHDHPSLQSRVPVDNRAARPLSRPGSFGRRCASSALSTAESVAFISSLLHRDLSLLQQNWTIDAVESSAQWLRLRRSPPRRIGTVGDGKAKIPGVADQCGELDAAGPDDECLIEVCGWMQNELRRAGAANSAAASTRVVRVAMWGLACVGPLLGHGGGLGSGVSGCQEVKDKLAGEVMQTLLWASTSSLATDPFVQSSLIIAATAVCTALGAGAAKHASTLSKLVKTGLEAPYSSCRHAAYRALAASVAHLAPSLPAPPDSSGRHLHETTQEPGLIRSLSGLLPQTVGPRLVGREGCWGEAVVAWEMVLQLLLRCPSTRESWAGPVAEAAGRLLASEEAPGPVVRVAAQCVTLLLLAGAAVAAADTVAAGKGPHSTYIASLTIQATRVCLGWGPATPSDVVARLCGAGRRETRWLLRLLPPFLVAAVPTRFGSIAMSVCWITELAALGYEKLLTPLQGGTRGAPCAADAAAYRDGLADIPVFDRHCCWFRRGRFES